MAELKIERASLVGNSMGGWIAALMAIKYPNRVEKIVLADAAGIIPASFNEADIYQLNNSTRDEIRANLKKIFANSVLQNNELLVDQFLTQRVLTNDGYTINSLIDSIKRKRGFSKRPPRRDQKTDAHYMGKTGRIAPGCRRLCI